MSATMRTGVPKINACFEFQQLVYLKPAQRVLFYDAHTNNQKWVYPSSKGKETIKFPLIGKAVP
jgi:hypothetical protein